MHASKRTKQPKKSHGGARANSGRPQKQDKDTWGQITCVLRHDTIKKLREGADSRFFGEYLQLHLDRFPPPDHATYQALLSHQPLMVRVKHRKTVPVIVSAGAANRVKRPPKLLSPDLQAFKARYDAIGNDVA